MNSQNNPKVMRAGIAGCGGISSWTLEQISLNSNIRVTAAQDIDKKTLSRFAENFNISNAHTCYDDILEEDIDFIIINSPNHVHLEQFEKAARAGKHCLVQKPISRNLDEARRMLEILRKTRIKAGVILFELSDPLNNQIKKMVSSGFIGTPCLINACNAHDIYLKTPPRENDWRRDPEKVGGGAFMQLAIHHTNLASWILDSSAVQVSAFALSDHTVFKEETSVASIRFEAGVLASFSASWATTGPYISIHGTEGYIHKFTDTLIVKGNSDFNGEVFDYTLQEGEKNLNLKSIEKTVSGLRAKYEIHSRFARHLAENEPFPCPLETGVEDMKVIEAVHRSIKTGLPVRTDEV